MSLKRTWCLCIITLVIYSCNNRKVTEASTDSLSESLLFHASFDKSTTADFAKGDSILYDTPSPKALDSVSSSLEYATTVSLAPGKGINGGGALEFKDNLDAAVFYKAQNNVNFQSKNWQGTISFWLKFNPNTDLKVMYSDPIQITESDYQNATIWIDFPNSNNSRMLRLGVLGDMSFWSSEDKQQKETGFFHRVHSIENPPFTGEHWTHIAITHDKLGSGHGNAKLYINGEPAINHPDIKDTFTWHHKNSRIYLGFSYTGLIDELKIFDRQLSENNIKHLSKLNLEQK